jgi:hypothetical protein
MRITKGEQAQQAVVGCQVVVLAALVFTSFSGGEGRPVLVSNTRVFREGKINSVYLEIRRRCDSRSRGCYLRAPHLLPFDSLVIVRNPPRVAKQSNPID